MSVLADMTAFVIGDPELDFFEQNPELRYLPVFRNYVDRVDGSRILWAVYLTEDVKSKFFRYRHVRRRELVADNYLNEPDFVWDEHEDLVAAYRMEALTREERNYKKMAEKYDDMVQVVFEQSAETLEEVSKLSTVMFGKLESINNQLQQAEKSLAQRYTARSLARGREVAGWASTKKRAS
jgi:hypothetical protein